MEKERIGVISAPILGIVALFLPWVSVNMGWGMNFSLNLFRLGEIAGWHIPGLEIGVGLIAIFMFLASIIVSVLYQRLSPVVPYLKIVPLITSLFALASAIFIVILGSDTLSPLSVFDFLGLGFYLFLIAGIILFISSLALKKKSKE